MGVIGVFKEEMIREMVCYVERFVIMFLFNFIKLVEVILKDIIYWIDGKVLIVIGSFFDLVEYRGIIYEIG